MHWWLFAGLALIMIAFAIQALLWRRRRDRLHDRDVNRRIDERLDGIDLRRRHRDEPQDSQTPP